MPNSEETHLDYLVREDGVKPLEELYLDYRRTYLYHRLAWVQKAFDVKKFPQTLAYLVMVIYSYENMDKYGEYGRVKEFLSSQTTWELDKFSELRGKSLRKKISMAISIEYPNLSSERKAEIENMVKAAWQWLHLGKDEGEEFGKIKQRKKELYSLIGSKPDRERREIIEILREKDAPRARLELVNVGIVPTERCVNNCRFCLSAWKPSRRERNLGEGSFEKIACEAVDFAREKNLILTVTGGEPFLEMEKLEFLIKGAGSRLDITTSGVWASSTRKAEEVLERLEDARRSNSNPEFHLSLQLSLDAFHQEVFLDEQGNYYQNVPMENILRVIETAPRKAPGIELVLLTKLSTYPDPLAQLILRLRGKGYTVELKDRLYDEGFKLPLLGQNGVTFRPALFKAYMEVASSELGVSTSILIFYTAVESMGKALALDSFEYPSFRREAEQLLKGDFDQPLPLVGIEISDDGYVYPGAHSLCTWSAGNLLEEGLDEICEKLSYDPLVRVMDSSPGLIVKLARELEDVQLENESSPLAVLYKLLERPEPRLYITKRLLQELPEYAGLAEELAIPPKDQLLQNL